MVSSDGLEFNFDLNSVQTKIDFQMVVSFHLKTESYQLFCNFGKIFASP